MPNIEKVRILQNRVATKRAEHEDRLADILQDELDSAEVETASSVGQFLERLKEEDRAI